MNNKEKVICDFDIVRFISENNANLDNCIVSETARGIEVNIYLYKENDKYYVRIYTSKEKYDLYDFSTFGDAKDFMDYLPYEQPKYKERYCGEIVW